MKIYITRHGQVLPKEFIGTVDFPKGDVPLSEKGKQQAICLGKELLARNFKGIIISSPYNRTMTTANLAAKECGAPVYMDGALREMVFKEESAAVFKGMTIEELKARFNEVASDAKLEYPWWTTKPDTLEMIAARLEDFWEKILYSDYEELMVVGHGASVFGSINYFSKKCGFGFPKVLSELGEYLADRNLNCNLSYIELDENRKLVTARMFATTHLTEDMLTSNSNSKVRPEEVIK